MKEVLDIIKNETLTYNQQVLQLAAQAENMLNVLNIDDETKELLDKNIIHDMFEGNAPYHRSDSKLVRKHIDCHGEF